MNAFVVDETQTPLEQENQVLRYFQEANTTNPKKLVKMARRIEHTVPAFIKRSIIDTVIESVYPAKFLAEAYKQMHDFPIIMQQLIDEGNHGMILDGAKIHGFEVKANPRWLRENDKWCLDDETEVMNNVVEEWMTAQKRRVFTGTIVLFQQFGFTGMPRKVDQAFTPEFFDNLVLDGVSPKAAEHVCRLLSKV